MVKKQNAYKNKFLMNLKACLDNSEFKNIIHWTTDNTFKIENLDTFIKKSKDKFKSKNLFLRNLRDFCFNKLKNNSNGISLYHDQFKKGITAEEIKRIKKEKKNNTYSFNEVKLKLMKELEKEKKFAKQEKEIAKQEKEIEELKELTKKIAIKLFIVKMKRKKEEEKKNNINVMFSSEESKNYFNDNCYEYQGEYNTSGPSKIQTENDNEKYRSTSGERDLKNLKFS